MISNGNKLKFLYNITKNSIWTAIRIERTTEKPFLHSVNLRHFLSDRLEVGVKPNVYRRGKWKYAYPLLNHLLIETWIDTLFKSLHVLGFIHLCFEELIQLFCNSFPIEWSLWIVNDTLKKIHAKEENDQPAKINRFLETSFFVHFRWDLIQRTNYHEKSHCYKLLLNCYNIEEIET